MHVAMASASCWRSLVPLILLAACNDAPAHDPELEVWAVEEELRIGSVNDPETQLTRVNGVAVAEDGRIYVGQDLTGTIRAYDPSGELFAVLGGIGSGPGEYSFVSNVGIVGDTLYAINRSPAYVNYYTLEGAHIGGEARSFDGGGVFFATPPQIILPDRRAVVIPTPLTGRTSGERPWLLIDAHDAILDTIFVEQIPRATIQRGNGSIHLSVPNARPPRFSLSSNYSVVGVADWEEPSDPTGSFRVSSLSPEGDTIATAVYDYAAVPVPDAIVDSTFQEIVNGLVERYGYGKAEAERAVREGIYIPRHHPPVGLVFPIDDGSLWLYRWNPRPGAEMEWQVIAPDGSRVARIDFPPD